VKEGKLTGIDYYHCKGCGICANVCPFGAITVKEGSQP
jgi:pyruvate ferredoxin oxidoreductase delta subunit